MPETSCEIGSKHRLADGAWEIHRQHDSTLYHIAAAPLGHDLLTAAVYAELLFHCS